MSFDLFFCWELDQLVDFDAVCTWAKGFEYFAREDHQLWYQNEDTGVYFSFDFEGQPAAVGEGPEIPAGLFNTGLSFNLNFNRPSYFGYEAMPVVESLCKRFGLSAHDPQAHDPAHILRDVKSTDLLEGWLKCNHNAILTMIEHTGMASPPRIPITKSLYRWNYSRNKKTLQAKCGERIFVPTLFPVRRTGSNQVELAFVCTQGVACLVPISDWVFIVRERKEHFWSGKQSETGIVSAGQFRDLLVDKLETFDSDLSSHLIPPKHISAVNRLLQSCEFELPREEFEGVALDAFVDIELDSKTAPN